LELPYDAVTQALGRLEMTKYLTGVLSVMAAGVLLIAYGLLTPQATSLSYPNQNPYGAQAAYTYGAQSSFGAGASVPCANGMQVTYPYGNPYPGNGAVAGSVNAQPVGMIAAADSAPVVRRRTAVRTVVRSPRRDWKKTALVVGGSTATAAGIGALVGGKKGALVGAALGGCASTLFETTRNR
jgi:hypothetical protein